MKAEEISKLYRMSPQPSDLICDRTESRVMAYLISSLRVSMSELFTESG